MAKQDALDKGIYYMLDEIGYKKNVFSHVSLFHIGSSQQNNHKSFGITIPMYSLFPLFGN